MEENSSVSTYSESQSGRAASTGTVTLKTKIIFKHKTESEWNNISYVPDAGELIVYDADENGNDHARVKLGDGITQAKALDFTGAQVDDTLAIADMAADAKTVGDRLAAIESNVADLMYTPITISSLTNNVNTVEMGSKVTSVTFNWKTNKTPKSLIFADNEFDVSTTSKTLTGLSLTANKTWTLKVTDERGATASKSTGISFVNKAYWGVGTTTSGYTSAFILGLANKTLTTSRARTFTVSPTTGQYIYYCVPTALGACSFKLNGFGGGFMPAETVSFTNASGYTTNYYIYRSAEHSLGAVEVIVS